MISSVVQARAAASQHLQHLAGDIREIIAVIGLLDADHAVPFGPCAQLGVLRDAHLLPHPIRQVHAAAGMLQIDVAVLRTLIAGTADLGQVYAQVDRQLLELLNGVDQLHCRHFLFQDHHCVRQGVDLHHLALLEAALLHDDVGDHQLLFRGAFGKYEFRHIVFLSVKKCNL